MMPRYRVWDKTKNEMIFLVGWRLYNLDQYQLFTLDGHRILNIDDAVFEQFTGLLDKSGKEIYGEDVCKVGNFDDPRSVFWDEKRAAFYINTLKGNIGPRLLCDLAWEHHNIVEVIGTIHDEEKP